MSSASLTFDKSGLDNMIARFDDPSIKEQLTRLPHEKAIAALVGQAIADNFEKEGPGWAPLKPDTIRGSVSKTKFKQLKNMTDEQLLRYEKRARQSGTQENASGPHRQILRRTGLLMASASQVGAKGNVWKTEGTNLIWGTNLVYAAIHNNGGVIRPKTKKQLAWKNNTGWHFAKSVTIPKRQFMIIRDEWMKKINDLILTMSLKIVMEKITKGGS